MITTTDSVPAVTTMTNPKSRFIRRMFDSIAPDYDRLNAWVSMGMDRGWRRKAVKRMPSEGWIVDWCAGTGDMTREYLKRPGANARIVMCDFSTEMRRLTGKKLADVDESGCYYVCCDVTHLVPHSRRVSSMVRCRGSRCAISMIGRRSLLRFSAAMRLMVAGHWSIWRCRNPESGGGCATSTLAGLLRDWYPWSRIGDYSPTATCQNRLSTIRRRGRSLMK